MREEVVKPNLSNFIKSLRDVGYNFNIAIADILDNSIDANAKNIKINIELKPQPKILILDNGFGMNEEELVEAMRLASKDPNKNRGGKALGKFGLGLKTASFSQGKKLTVISKKGNKINARVWDLNHIEETNEWYLLTPQLDYDSTEFYNELTLQESGTLVIIEEIDRYEEDEYENLIYSLRNHLSMTFHRFLDNKNSRRKVNISLNNNPLESFDPFNSENFATQDLGEEKLKVYDEDIKIKPYILPHHSKISQQDYDKYGTEEGYTKTQGFYVYRANRLLIHGTWLGLHKISDSHKLVRIMIDIPNNQDSYWGIDIKKSTAKPVKAISKELKRIIKNVTAKGSRPYTGRGKRITDKNIEKFWDLIPDGDNIKFGLKKKHPIYSELLNTFDEKQKNLFNLFVNGIESYLPLPLIQAHLNDNPHKIKQKNNEEISEAIQKLIDMGVSPELIEAIKKTELKGEMTDVREKNSEK
ncbi:MULTISPECIES: ATP-binding protein [Psychrilyobacter]|uniref:ATP-binding protein n=1 Tax=Psychrilyobacter piezotolerans TaxID=2293438 RepID=A0ABX9KIX5_9FUSO|nr:MULTISPECIES: ATP-binding protein [Psychrilyobacter]MCS5420299.1 ATP-binding protein [Psychrilyobacter sp. S5]NDI77325.1 ATP-binding protein [Psychrilyobacter piezotolerans]RDE63374.1 ATP-binding protein [Psychrilyobacter sp. S5]REI41916.1 ATP-binding protein [Psychrilyobacter piezotolerans]